LISSAVQKILPCSSKIDYIFGAWFGLISVVWEED